MNSGPQPYDSRRPRPRFAVHVDNVLIPLVLIATIAAAIGAHQHWLHLPFLLSVALGVPDGLFLTFGGVWLVGFFAKSRR